MLLFVQIHSSSHCGAHYFYFATLREYCASFFTALARSYSLFIAFVLGFASVLTDISSGSEKSINKSEVYVT